MKPSARHFHRRASATATRLPLVGYRDAIAARGSPCRSAGRRECGARNRRSRPIDRRIRAFRRSYMKTIRFQ
jgi:hypothetical protein